VHNVERLAIPSSLCWHDVEIWITPLIDRSACFWTGNEYLEIDQGAILVLLSQLVNHISWILHDSTNVAAATSVLKPGDFFNDAENSCVVGS
jgi:hypothetical protein